MSSTPFARKRGILRLRLRPRPRPRPIAISISIGAALVVLPGPDVDAVTVRVPADAPTIQAGIDSTVAIPDEEGVLDTVLVAAGVYTGDGNRNLDFSRLTSPVPNDIVLRSEGGAAVTILDLGAGPDDNARGFLFRSSESRDAILEGFTIRNGWMGGAPIAGSHGRVGASGPGEGRRAAQVTAGVTARVATRAPTSERHELSGAGILVRFFTSPTIRDCVIESNYSEYSGGGVETEFGAEPRFERCVIRSNESAFVGGGGSFETGWDARPELVDCVITGNRAAVSGGGISTELSIDVIGTVVAGNVAPEGGGIRVTEAASPTLTRSILWRNGSGADGNLRVDAGAILTLACSAVDTTAMTVLGTLDLGDSIVTDPIFCDPVPFDAAPTSDGDYRLAINSPCLPAGSPCGSRIGPLDAGCGPGTPVRTITWGRLREWFGDRSGVSR